MRGIGFVAMGMLAVGCGGSRLEGSVGRAPAPVSPLAAAAAAAAVSAPEAGSEAAPARCARLRPGTGATRAAAERQGSTVALARAGSTTIAYAADEDDDAIHTFDLDAGVELAVTPLGGSPAQILVLADGRVAVALRDRNRVAILEPAEHADAPLEERCEAPVAVEPVGLAATPDDARLLVTSGFGHALTALDPADLGAAFTVDLPREPRSVVVDEAGQRAFVAHVVGARLSAVTLGGAAHPVHDIALRFSGARLDGCQGFALAKTVVAAADKEGPAAERIFAPMVSASPGGDRISFGYGGSLELPAERPLVSVVDAIAERPLARDGSEFARHRQECLLPRAAATGPGDALFVTCLGIDSLLELDARSATPVTAERRRFRVPAGPTGVAVDAAHGRAVVWSQFARELALVDLAAPTERPALRIPAARRQDSAMTAELERGRAIFHATDDRRISRDGRACASCHPDGREDALTWSTPDGPRQTIMLAGRLLNSEPYGWFGVNKTLVGHVTTTFTRLGGAGFAAPKDRPDLKALLAYLVAMRAPTLAGAPVDSARAERVERGRALFHEGRQGCGSCHFDAGTDKSAHDVKSGDIDERSLAFDTPSLRFVSGTAPYFHDGRFKTLEDVLERSDGSMGHTLHLARPDLLALSAYLETL